MRSSIIGVLELLHDIPRRSAGWLTSSTKIMVLTRLADADAVPTREGGCQIGSDEAKFLFWNAKSRSGRGIFKMNLAATASEQPLSARPAIKSTSSFQ
jgi:hypothetical protein